jgi:hypothetical protein
VVIPLYALSIVSILTSVALVIDTAQLRTDRRINKGVADAAARAGIGRLHFGPWSGVCKARDYLLGNGPGFSTFDAGSERWSNVATPPASLASSPCPGVASQADSVPCAPNNPGTWAKLTATAKGGAFTIEIQSGYPLPDPRFPEDAVSSADVGGADQGWCDNLAVIITQNRSLFFAPVAGIAAKSTRVRSVARLNSTETLDFVAALHLLEQHKCNVLQTGGTNTRVVAQPNGPYPGIIQIDSADDTGSCPSPILNAQATSDGPSVIACSSVSTSASCQPGSGTRPSRVGIYALNFVRPAGDIATAFPTTYGDTAAVATPRTGRRFADRKYRAKVADFDAEVKSVLRGNGGLPPGCSAVVANACTGNGQTWLVLQPTDCQNLGTFFNTAGRTASQNIWFNCDLNVSAPLTLSASSASVVVTGQLAVNSVFTVQDPRTFYVGGRSTGNKIGVDIGGTASVLNLNQGSAGDCKSRTGPGHATRFVVGDGSFNVASGATLHMCQTFLYLASGFDKVPATDGTPPCSTPCSSYLGTVTVGSGAFLDWSAPNEISGRIPDPVELSTTNLFEDLALWTEAGGNTNGLSGGSATNLTGVFFLPNADSFNLAGGGSLPIYLSAQFISTSLKVTGGATVNLVPQPEDSIAVVVYSTLLVR